MQEWNPLNKQFKVKWLIVKCRRDVRSFFEIPRTGGVQVSLSVGMINVQTVAYYVGSQFNDKESCYL